MASLCSLSEFLQVKVFEQLDATDLARLCIVSRQLREDASKSFLWKGRCGRWKTWPSGRYSDLAESGAFKAIYGERDQLDRRARKLVLEELPDPRGFKVHLLELFRMGPSVRDALREDGQLDSPMDIGRSTWAREAMVHIQCRESCEAFCKLVSTAGPHAPLEDGAFLLAQTLYPVADLDRVRQFLDDLASEFKRRMAAAGITGGVAALQMLSEFLFDQHPSQGTRDEDYDDTYVESFWTDARSWSRLQEGALKVPREGEGLGLKGNRRNFSDPANSLLPYVLATGRGIPLTLCLIHSAVGRRAGLNICGVNMPIHFVNRFGELGSSEERFVDCFNRGRVLKRGELFRSLGPEVWIRFQLVHDESVFMCANPRDVWIRMISNMQNSMTGNLMHADERPPRALALCNMLQCGILRAFTRQPYFVQQELVTEYCLSTWADGVDLLPWMNKPVDEDVPMEIPPRVMRRSEHPHVKHRIGDVLTSYQNRVRVMITGWDIPGEPIDDVMMAEVARKEPGDGEEVMYYVLTDLLQCQGRLWYLPQSALSPQEDPLTDLQQLLRRVITREFQRRDFLNTIGRYFEAWVSGEERLRPLKYLRELYPED